MLRERLHVIVAPETERLPVTLLAICRHLRRPVRLGHTRSLHPKHPPYDTLTQGVPWLVGSRVSDERPFRASSWGRVKIAALLVQHSPCWVSSGLLPKPGSAPPRERHTLHIFIPSRGSKVHRRRSGDIAWPGFMNSINRTPNIVSLRDFEGASRPVPTGFATHVPWQFFHVPCLGHYIQCSNYLLTYTAHTLKQSASTRTTTAAAISPHMIRRIYRGQTGAARSQNSSVSILGVGTSAETLAFPPMNTPIEAGNLLQHQPIIRWEFHVHLDVQLPLNDSPSNWLKSQLSLHARCATRRLDAAFGVRTIVSK